MLQIKHKQATFETNCTKIRKSQIMNTYFIRRLLPFYAIGVLIEVLCTGYEIYLSADSLDYSFLTIVKSLGITITTTTLAFLLLMIPYTLYLVICPDSLQNSKLDKIISSVFFFIYVSFCILEELCVIQIRQELTSFQMLIDNSGPINIISSLIIAALSLKLTYKSLTTDITSPRLLNRIFQGCVYLLICFMVFQNTHMHNLTTQVNLTNDEIAREDTFTLLHSTIEHNLDE